MTSWNPCGARHIRPQASGLPRRSQLRRLMGRVGQPRRHPHRNLTAPFPLPLSSRMRGPIPLPGSQLVGAVSEPPVPFPSLITRRSQLSTAEPRNLVVVAPLPSRAPPVVLADAGTHPPARQPAGRGGSRTARPLSLSNHPSFPAKHSRVEESRCRSTPSLPRLSRCPRGCGDPSPCPSFQRPTPSTGGSRTARPLPLSNHPSFPAKHSGVEESRCRSTPLPPAPLPLSSRMRGPIPLPVIPAPHFE